VNGVAWIWILIGLSVLLNIASLMLLIQYRKISNIDKNDEVQAIQQSMENFVANMERENDELYQRLAEYLKVNQQSTEEQLQSLEEKIRFLEEKLEQEANIETIDEPSNDSEAWEPPNVDVPSQFPQDEEKVLQLYKQGFSSSQIAKVLQMDNGKVELIINLFKRRQSSK
jgi:DNA-binding NarL/FixJ family response regulator